MPLYISTISIGPKGIVSLLFSSHLFVLCTLILPPPVVFDVHETNEGRRGRTVLKRVVLVVIAVGLVALVAMETGGIGYL